MVSIYKKSKKMLFCLLMLTIQVTSSHQFIDDVMQVNAIQVDECFVPEKLHFKIFVSSHLSKDLIEYVIQEAATHHAQIVIRGKNAHVSMHDTLNFWQTFFRGNVFIPNIVIDPTIFSKAKVVSVPAIVAFYDDIPLAKVTGITSVQWLKDKLGIEKMANGHFGNGTELNRPFSENQFCHLGIQKSIIDFGLHGPTRSISEIDMIEEIHTKLSQIDWSEKTHSAMNRYWASLPTFNLAKAKNCRTKLIDASIEINQALVNHLGEELISAGTRINPFDYLPFTLKMIVFDVNEPNQLRQIDDFLITSPLSNLLIANVTHGKHPLEKQLNELSIRFNQPIFLLNKTVKERFDVTHTPSLIIGNKGYFEVKEGCLI